MKILRSLLWTLSLSCMCCGGEDLKARLPAAPGVTQILEFPELGPDRQGRPAQCQVSIPAGYDPAKKVPLVVWLSGGAGGGMPNRVFLPAGDFVAAAFPFPKGADNPGQSDMVGAFEKIWAYHKPMLDEIHRRIPNIDRTSSIIAGFSNGGHAIDGMLRRRNKEGGLKDYFGVFILIDGGGTEASGEAALPSLEGKFAYICWGEKSPMKPALSAVVNEFKTKGATVVSSEMAGTGHAFADSEQPKIRDWLANSVLPALGLGQRTAH